MHRVGWGPRWYNRIYARNLILNNELENLENLVVIHHCITFLWLNFTNMLTLLIICGAVNHIKSCITLHYIGNGEKIVNPMSILAIIGVSFRGEPKLGYT